MTDEEVSRVQRQPYRASTSFSNEEVSVAVRIMEQLLIGGDISPVLLRSPSFSSLLGKFQRMKKKSAKDRV